MAKYSAKVANLTLMHSLAMLLKTGCKKAKIDNILHFKIVIRQHLLYKLSGSLKAHMHSFSFRMSHVPYDMMHLSLG